MTVSDIFLSATVIVTLIKLLTFHYPAALTVCTRLNYAAARKKRNRSAICELFKMKLISRSTFTAVITCFNGLQTLLPHTTCELLIKLFGTAREPASCVVRVNVADDIGSLVWLIRTVVWRTDDSVPQSRFHNVECVINGKQTKFTERLAAINICGCVSAGRLSFVSVNFSVCLIYCEMLMVFDSLLSSTRLHPRCPGLIMFSQTFVRRWNMH